MKVAADPEGTGSSPPVSATAARDGAAPREQLSLFVTPRARGEPDAAGVKGAVRAHLGGALDGVTLPAHVLGGTSSWSFPGWRGLVYEGEHSATALARAGLAAYASHKLLGAVGLDKTFYRPSPVAEFARLGAQVGDQFRFLVKAHRDCTTVFRRDPDDPRRTIRNPRFLEPEYATEAVVRPAVDGLGARLGVLLFQFPPEAAFNGRGAPRLRERIEAFLRRLPSGVPYAFEVRNREVLSPDYGAMLRGLGAAHGYCVHPTMPSVSQQRAILGGADVERPRVLRWMLGHGRAYEEAKQRYAPFDALREPAPDVRREIVALLGSRRADPGSPGCIVIVNNKAEGCSPRSLVSLAAAFHAVT